MLLAYTINAAKAINQQASLGSIEAGKLPAFTMVDSDVTTVPDEALRHTKLLGTMVDGKWVYGGAQASSSR
jgi:predicted amidohydrolase YtcJ